MYRLKSADRLMSVSYKEIREELRELIFSYQFDTMFCDRSNVHSNTSKEIKGFKCVTIQK